MMEFTCKTCLYWHALFNDYRGECRRHAPKRPDASFPVTQNDSWCGEGVADLPKPEKPVANDGAWRFILCEKCKSTIRTITLGQERHLCSKCARAIAKVYDDTNGLEVVVREKKP